MAKATLPADLPLWHPAVWLSTWFGSGLLPVAPGTWGSLAALPFAWVILAETGPWGLAAAAVLVFAAGLWAAGRYVRDRAEKDPGSVVIDEVAGQWLTLLAAAPGELWHFAAGFLLFRLFDIVKPWPVRLVERRFAGGLGIMGDDVAAAIYAGDFAYVLFNLETLT